jgi:steroid delta-isomerase-like uncharacterized protein
MNTQTNQQLVQRWIAEGWNKGNLAIIDELYAPDFVQHDPQSPLPVNSAADLKRYVSGFRMAFPDLRMSVDDLIAEGDKVVWRFTGRGHHTGPLGPLPPAGRLGVVTGIVIFRYLDGKITEAWVNMDNLGMLQQIGVIPTPG